MAINMSYCKFENTLSALRQCEDEWNEVESDSEKKSKERLIQLMVELLESEGYEVEMED